MSTTTLRRSAWIGAALPGIWLPLLVWFVFRTHDASGKALYPMAKYSPYQVHFTVTQFLFLGFPILALAAAYQVYMLRRRDPDVHILPVCVLLVSTVAVSAAVAALNPGGYFRWFFD